MTILFFCFYVHPDTSPPAAADTILNELHIPVIAIWINECLKIDVSKAKGLDSTSLFLITLTSTIDVIFQASICQFQSENI